MHVCVWDKGEVCRVWLMISRNNISECKKEIERQLHNVHSYFGVVGDCIAKRIPGDI